MRSRWESTSRLQPQKRQAPTRALFPTRVPPSSLSPGSRLRGEGQGARAAEDQQGRGSLPWERLQRQVPGPRQEGPPPAPPGQEAQRADQPEKEQKERQGEMKVLVTSLRQPRSFLGLTAQATNTKDALKGGAEPQRERGAHSGCRQLGASVPWTAE